jgi:uncharacterized RDD family membrane protein YckC
MRWRNVKKHARSNKSESATEKTPVTYAGFWKRVLAFMTDLFMIGMPITLFIMFAFGHDQMNSATGLDVIMDPEAAKAHAPNPVSSILQLVLSMLAYTIFWHKTGQTPGKKLAEIKVVDAETMQNGSYFQLGLRYIGYFISFVSVIGFFTGLLREDKRTLHDLISRTAVIDAPETKK